MARWKSDKKWKMEDDDSDDTGKEVENIETIGL